MRKLSILIFVALSACGKTENQNFITTLVETDKQIILPLSSTTPNVSHGLTYLAEEDLLFNLNWNENAIQIYDLNSKTILKNLLFDQEGPKGVGKIFGIHPHSVDSIFIFNAGLPAITMIDSSGAIIDRFEYTPPEAYQPAFVHNAYFHSPPKLQNGKLAVKTRYEIRITDMTQEKLQDVDVIYEIDLKSGETEFKNLKFPKDYMPNGVKQFETSIAHSPNKTVYSLFGDHRLFYLEDDKNELKSVKGKSDFLPDLLPYIPENPSGSSFRDYMLYSPHYGTLDYDPFREVFIRFAFQKNEVDKSATIDGRVPSPPFSIQVFDKGLKLISETALPSNQYHPFDYFISEEGIYLSINHPLNPKNKENELTFRLVEYQKVLE